MTDTARSNAARELCEKIGSGAHNVSAPCADCAAIENAFVMQTTILRLELEMTRELLQLEREQRS